jgi:NADH dehydrogenase [ubiquinone] 1 alpha subcomplex assembly factor 6
MDPTRLSYCADQVRRQDRDRYLTVLFAPADRREDLFALYAFNLEVAKTAEMVSEAMLGQIRLQWWREAIEEIYRGRPRHHAVAEPLARAVSRRGLPRAPFDRLIDAREADLMGEPPPDLAALETYAEGTAAGLFALALGVLGSPADQGPTAEAAHHLGLAWAITGLTRSVPFHARQKRSYLPVELTRQSGLDPAELFALRASPALARVVERLAERAGDHLQAVRRLRPKLPRRAASVLLFVPLAEDYLRRLRRAGFDPFDAAVQVECPGAVWRLAWAAVLRRY